ncbi:MAG TPA: hypothetical protein VGF84_23985 [Micromonosporaceae bacterium]|jgi:hypothetical protein
MVPGDRDIAAVPPSTTYPVVSSASTPDRRKWRLIAGLLFRDGCFGASVSVLTGLADAGDEIAGQLLAGLLAQADRLPHLRRRARGGDVAAIRHLAALAAEYGWEDELRGLAALDVYAACALASLWCQRGRLEDALPLLRSRSDAGDFPAQVRLASLLAEQNRTLELRQRAFAGDWPCALQLVEKLYQAGQPAQAIAVLRCAAGDARSTIAAPQRTPVDGQPQE